MIATMIETANVASSGWAIWLRTGVWDSALVFGLVGCIWLLIRRHASPRMGHLLFLLIPLKLILPVHVNAPRALAGWFPTVVISSWISDSAARGMIQGEASTLDVLTINAGSSPRDSGNVIDPDAPDSVLAASTAMPQPVPHPDIDHAPRSDQDLTSKRVPRSVTDPSVTRPSAIQISNAATPRLSVLAIAMLGWTLCVVFLTAKLCWIQVQFRRRVNRLRRDPQTVSDMDLRELCQRAGVRTPVTLLVTDEIAVPAVWGILRPVILLPRRVFHALSPGQLQWVLLHELAHLRRGDLLVLILQRIVAMLYFFNPVVWIANRLIQQFSELACDDLAVEQSDGSSIDSGEAFLTVLRHADQRQPQLTGALGMFGLDSRTACFQRVGRLLDSDQPHGTKLGFFHLSGLVLLSGLLLPHLHAAADPAPQVLPKPAPVSSPPATSPEATTEKPPLAHEVGQFELRVVGPDGQAVVDAAVEVRMSSNLDSADILQGNFVSKGKYGTFLKADSAGVLVLKFPESLSGFSVSIQLAGYGPYWAGWSSANHPDPVPAKFTAQLDAAWSAGATIVDSDGRPVVGAEVRPSVDFKKRPGDTSRFGTGTQLSSDEAGKWRFHSVPVSKEELWVEINHADFMPLRLGLKRVEFGLEAGQEPAQKIVLDRGLTVTGTVTDLDGKPISGALVRTKFMNDLRTTTTQEDGTYKLTGCESRVARIVVSAQGKAVDMQELRIVEGLETVDFVMQPGGKIRIRVLDENDQPIPKAIIFFQNWRRGYFTRFEFDHVNQYADDQGVWEWNEAPLDTFEADICRPGGMYLSHEPLIARDEEYIFHPPGPLVISGKVTDAETGEPLKTFDVIPGYRYESGKLSWNQKGRFTATEGKYELRQTDGRSAYLVRIESSGYQAEVSRDIKLDEGATTIDFKLKKGRDVAAQVISPDGTPAAEARIALGVVGAQISLKNGDFQQNSTYCEIQQSDATGNFRFLPQEKPFQLVVVHPTGFAYLEATSESAPTEIKLQAWARVEGVFHVNREAVADASLTIDGTGPQSWGEGLANISSTHVTKSDQDGHFKFNRVFPGQGRIGREIVMMVVEGATEVTSSCKLRIELEPGETTNIDFGKSGRPITGRLQHADPNTKVDWKQFVLHMTSVLPVLPQLEAPPVPAAIAKDPKKQADWLNKWQTTEAGKAWFRLKAAHEANEQLEQSKPYFEATLNSDGSFRIDDVPAGDFSLQIGGSKLGNISVKPSMPESSNEAQDIGVFQFSR